MTAHTSIEIATPAHLKSTAVTSTTITISWMLGFNGGESIDTVTVSYAASGNNASVSEGTISLAASATTAYTLQDLQPLTNYTITVIVGNDWFTVVTAVWL